MFLKRVKLRNFKSFSGTTEVPFEPGFTGVAGPNGMGKSNISDAILFVLGPTSSKALRADRLTHLFFNGGASKKAATECEVSLVFDNEDRLLTVDSPEVEITRYVKLAPSDPNGYYSYFYVNGRRTTQSEIEALLAHARLSGDGYNLVQQGDVNRIVSMGPIPRRGLVERLAGISQYDEQLERADTKRGDLESNLEHIRTLLGEIRSRLGQLDSQRAQAVQYKALQDQRRLAEARLARAGHLLAQKEVRTGEESLARLADEIANLESERARLAAQSAELGTSIDAIDAEIAKRGGTEAANFQQQLNDRRMAYARLDENVKNLESDVETLGERVQALATQGKSDEKSLAQSKASVISLEEKLHAVEAKVAETASRLAAATGEAEQSQGKLTGARKQISDLERAVEEHGRSWQAAVASHEAAKAALDGAEREEAQAEDDRRTRELEVKDVELRLRKADAGRAPGTDTATLQKELFQLRAKEAALTEKAAALGKEVFELNRRYTALDARLKVRGEAGGGNPFSAVEFLLSQRNLGRVAGIRGTVSELARIDGDYETALHVAAGGRFQALVVETDQVAEECVKLLRQEKRGRATFLPLNRMLGGRPKGKSLLAAQSPGAVGFAIDLVKFDEELRPAFWYVFGETVVMKDLARAREQMGGVRLVTLAGDLVEATGAITGGSLDAPGRNKGADSASELKRLAEELRARSEEESSVRAELAKASERVRTLGEELARRSATAQAHSSASELLGSELTGARERLTEARKRLDAAVAARTKAEKALTAAASAAEDASEALAKAKQELARLNDAYLGHLPGAVSTRIRSLQDAHGAAMQDQVAAARELEGARASLAAAEQALGEKQRQLATDDATLATQRKQLKALRAERDGAKEALEALRAVEQQQTRAVESHLAKKRGLESDRVKLLSNLARAEEAIRGRATMRTQEEVHLAQARQKLAEVESTLKELPAPAADEAPIPVDELRRTVETLSNQLEAMGPVNLRALEEYDLEKHRLDEFESESERLTSERAELVKLVGEIEKKKREKIGEVVVSVDAAFRTIYADLSGGGEGAITLENPADPLAGGLLIQARPVGKTVQRLEQLSGGEKSLASLAFIFSLQRHDPSPLYVFDEVDMSLDGVNAENVGRMLRRNAERAQFVVISLRKVTLKFAHRLFGVTMHGDGCSRVVGLRLDEIVDVDERTRAEAAQPPPLASPPGAAP